MAKLTVGELRIQLEQLVKQHPDSVSWVVVSEGCDCDGDAGGLKIDWKGKTVLVEREVLDRIPGPTVPPKPGPGEKVVRL